MTNQVNLGIVWGSTGASTDPGDVNYQEGWLSEIPTFEEFNFVLQALNKNILTLAEKGGWVWQADINYVAGATVITSAGLIAHCKTDNINQDPATDTIGSYWASGFLVGAAAPNTLTIKDGVLVKDVNPRTATTWDGNDVTVYNDNALVALNTTGGATANVLIGNVSGSLVAIDVGTTAVPDGRSVALADPNVHLIYHQGNKPVQADVAGTIPDAPNDGAAYARKSAAWSVVTTTTVSDNAPAAELGGGAGWYNLADGQLYVDIDDGDSSQWVLANPPTIPVIPASSVPSSAVGSVTATTVQDAIAQLDGMIGRKNYLINGGFDIWQRGSSFPSANGYNSDRWNANLTASGGGGTVSRQAFTLGQTDVPNEPAYFMRLAKTTAGTGIGFLTQKIEGVRTFAGETVTLSFYAKAAAGQTATFSLVQRFGTGGSPSANVPHATAVNITTSWQKFTITVALTSITGKTLGTNGDDILFVQFQSATGVTFTVDIAQVQLEKGPLATDFEYRPIGEELALCKRYYQEVFIQSYASLGLSRASGSNVCDTPRISLPVTLRAVPSIGLSPALSDVIIVDLAGSNATTSATLVATGLSVDSFRLRATGGTLANTNLYGVTSHATATYAQIDAEL